MRVNRHMVIMFLSWIMAAALLSAPASANAQSIRDSVKVAKADSAIRMHSPNKATLLSAILPGTGQFYNKQYWKMPLIYGGFGIMVAVISFNQGNYHTFKNAYVKRVAGDSTADNYPQYTSSDLITLRDYYRRNRDFTYILAGVLYVLNIVDAYVDAELFKFDVGDDLSLHGDPFIINYSGNSTFAGLRLTLNF